MGVLIIAASGVAGLAGVWFLRRRPSGTAMTILVVLASAGVATGGLMLQDEVGVASWLVAPPVLAVGGVLQVRALLAPGGPFRT